MIITIYCAGVELAFSLVFESPHTVYYTFLEVVLDRMQYILPVFILGTNEHGVNPNS